MKAISMMCLLICRIRLYDVDRCIFARTFSRIVVSLAPMNFAPAYILDTTVSLDIHFQHNCASGIIIGGCKLFLFAKHLLFKCEMRCLRIFNDVCCAKTKTIAFRRSRKSKINLLIGRSSEQDHKNTSVVNYNDIIPAKCRGSQIDLH